MNDKKSPKNGKPYNDSADLNRRDLMKMGVGAVAMAQGFNPSRAEAQTGCAAPGEWVPMTRWQGATRRVARAGYKNDANRLFGNGPMDETSRRIVSYAVSYSEANLTDSMLEEMGYWFVDSIGCAMAGFDSEAIRVGARIARTTQSNLRSTVWGWGITTTPELAAFVNSCMVRHDDFNDNGAHLSDILPGILAVGEALHSNGAEVLAAIAVARDVYGALTLASPDVNARGWDNIYVGPATAVGVGRLLGLNEDRLANAVSLSLVPQISMHVSHTDGPLSMWKNCHDAEAVRCAVFASLLAREGMTGPCEPFEGRMGLWDDVTGPFKDFELPPKPVGNSDRSLHDVRVLDFKRFPAEGSAEATIQILPEFRKFTKFEDIASIDIEMDSFHEIGDPGKWDPRNEETADHSMPYIVARTLIDGEFYLDAFKRQEYMDPVVRQLMDKITIRENPDLRPGHTGHATVRITVRTNSGTEMTKETSTMTPMSHEEIIAKFNRNCAYKSVPDDQRDQIRASWSNIRGVKDIAEPIRLLEHFGKPSAL